MSLEKACKYHDKYEIPNTPYSYNIFWNKGAIFSCKYESNISDKYYNQWARWQINNKVNSILFVNYTKFHYILILLDMATSNALEKYCGTEVTSKDKNTFLEIINITVDSTIATVLLTVIQSSSRRLPNHWFAVRIIVD